MTTSLFTLLSCGSNAQGQLGNGSVEDAHLFQPCSFAGFPPSIIPCGASILDIACGANHTLLLLELGEKARELWGCGDGRKGQLGRNYRQNVSSTGVIHKLDLALDESSLEQHVIKAIGATWETSFVVLSKEGEKDVVISMGSDDYGDLGAGGIEKSQKGLRDFYVIEFNLDEKYTVPGIYCGQHHVIVQLITASGSHLLGWGTARHGQLGELSVPFTTTPQIIAIDPNNINSMALGMQHTVVLYNTGELLGLGSNRKGQLEVVRDLTIRNASIQMTCCTWNGTYAVERDGEIWTINSSGSHSHSQLGWKSSEGGPTTGKIVFSEAKSLSVSCGSEHVLVLEKLSTIDSPRLWGWGWNEHGNLGLGHTQDIPFPTRLYPSKEENVMIRKTWAGLGTSWILTERVVP